MISVRSALLLFGLGCLLFLGGWIYDVLFAGLPAQDATPQMRADWDFHKTIASYIRFGALGAWGLSVLCFAIMSFSEEEEPDRPADTKSPED
ncbi:MAG: hypothetical protein AAF441_03170 [Pseudomonadota bacterium]